MVRNRPDPRPAPNPPPRERNPSMPTGPVEGIADRVFRAGLSESWETAQQLRGDANERDVALRKTCDVELNARDIFGDGDQKRILNTRKGQPLRDAWCSGCDLYEKLENHQMSPFWVACFTGDHRNAARMIEAARNKPNRVIGEGDARESLPELTCLLERRETQMRLSPIHAVVAGARSLEGRAAEAFVECRSGVPSRHEGRRRVHRVSAVHERRGNDSRGFGAGAGCFRASGRGPGRFEPVRGDAVNRGGHGWEHRVLRGAHGAGRRSGQGRRRGALGDEHVPRQKRPDGQHGAPGDVLAFLVERGRVRG